MERNPFNKIESWIASKKDYAVIINDYAIFWAASKEPNDVLKKMCLICMKKLAITSETIQYKSEWIIIKCPCFNYKKEYKYIHSHPF